MIGDWRVMTNLAKTVAELTDHVKDIAKESRNESSVPAKTPQPSLLRSITRTCDLRRLYY